MEKFGLHILWGLPTMVIMNTIDAINEFYQHNKHINKIRHKIVYKKTYYGYKFNLIKDTPNFYLLSELDREKLNKQK